jgi:hypothetical protein
MVAGLLVFAGGVLLLAQVPVGSEYVSDLLPGLLLAGFGLGLAFVAFSIGALEGVSGRDAGLASGLSNTTQQIGGALGTAIMSTLAITRTGDLLATGTSRPEALTEGFQLALYASVGLAVAGALAVLALVRSGQPQEAEVSAEAAPEATAA